MTKAHYERELGSISKVTTGTCMVTITVVSLRQKIAKEGKGIEHGLVPIEIDEELLVLKFIFNAAHLTTEFP